MSHATLRIELLTMDNGRTYSKEIEFEYNSVDPEPFINTTLAPRTRVMLREFVFDLEQLDIQAFPYVTRTEHNV